MHTNLLRIIPPLNFRSQVALLFVSLAVATSAQAQVPSWWATGDANATSNNVRKPIINGNSALDLGIATVGQAKFIAWQARLELDSKFSEIGGAGEGIKAATDKFWLNNSNDKAVIAIGQVKYLSKLYYDRLFQMGMIKVRNYLYDDDANAATPPILTTSVAGKPYEIYPWTAALGSDDSDSSPATLGQLKKAFSFDISVPIIAGSVSAESDGDSIPDWIEFQLGLDPTDTTPAGRTRDTVKFAALKKGANCKGYEGTYTGAASQKPSRENVARFLNQASWGANLATIDEIRNMPHTGEGVYEKWINDQIWQNGAVKTLPAMDPPRVSGAHYPLARSPNYQIEKTAGADSNSDIITITYHQNYSAAFSVTDEDNTFNYAKNNISRLEGYMTYLWSRSIFDAKIQGNHVAWWAGYGSSISLRYPAGYSEQLLTWEFFQYYQNSWKLSSGSGYQVFTASDNLNRYRGRNVTYRLKNSNAGVVTDMVIPGVSNPTVVTAGQVDRDAKLDALFNPMLKAIQGGIAPPYQGNQAKNYDGHFHHRWNASYPAQSAAEHISTAWMRNVVHGDDPLRQRIAFALSQILVVSCNNFVIGNNATSAATYYDLLAEEAFGNYASLLKKVTFHPAMGIYLTHINNDGRVGKRPDENYAREILQLMSIGLWKLNEDGTFKLDTQLKRQATYTSQDVKSLAKVFTGFGSAGTGWGYQGYWGNISYSAPMIIYPQYHNFESKTLNILTEGPYTTPSVAQTAAGGKSEIDAIVEKLAKDKNTAPFISLQLIKKLVTSNPSPDYVKRVATVFYDKREDTDQLAYVVKAILMDSEARNFESIINPRFGKLKEPALRINNLVKALNAGKHQNYSYDPVNGVYGNGLPLFDRYFPKPSESTYDPYFDLIWNMDHSENTKQQFLRAPSVFNFYEQGYTKAVKLPESTNTEQLYAPEFQILNSASAVGTLNTLFNVASEEVGLELGITAPSPGITDGYLYTSGHWSGFGGRTGVGPNHVGLHPLDTTPYKPITDGSKDIGNIDPNVGKRFLCDTNGALCLFSTNPERYLDELDWLLCNGNMNYKTRAKIKSALNAIPNSDLANMMGIHMALASPEAAIQH
jgi:uncharacterized protein (DUF1800 family)